MTEQALHLRIFAALRALPLISLALLLGAGVVATGLLVWIVWLVGHGHWVPAIPVAITRVQSLTAIAIGLIVVIAIVTITLAWGRPDKIKIGFRGAEGEVDYPDAPPIPTRETPR